MSAVPPPYRGPQQPPSAGMPHPPPPVSQPLPPNPRPPEGDNGYVTTLLLLRLRSPQRRRSILRESASMLNQLSARLQRQR